MKLEFNLKDNLDKIKKSNSYFHTFINKDSLAAGILILKPGEEDTQEPHESDEVYFIISGNGFLKIKNKDYKFQKINYFLLEKMYLIIFILIQRNSKFCIFLVGLILKKYGFFFLNF